MSVLQDCGAPRRAVICDFGGVLTSPLLEGFAAVQARSGVSVDELSAAMARVAEARGSHPLFDLEMGRIRESEFLRLLEEALDGEVTLESFHEVFFSGLRPNRTMIDYMASLRERGLRMAILTNNVREWREVWRAKLPRLGETFHVVVDSAWEGMRKPDPAIYRLTLERLGDGLSAEECVFVDDTVANCETARSLGMHAVHFVENDQAVAEIEAALG
jgi:putative hydrolase of the HAD superfamily